MAKSKISKLSILTEFEVYNSIKDLAKKDGELLLEAQKILKNAYAPYSNFNVGAAVLLDNGKIVTGNNQENAAYPSGLCAERVAIFYAGAQYPNVDIKTIAITVKSKNIVIKEPLSPCGGCRQAIAEYENKSGKAIRIIMSGEKGQIYIAKSIESLLPLMFSKKYL
ncbi:MAG: cytidine deaminase [Bacteroidetes bacterium]|jgi:cytidine deaminase|nr:cytidine deaminase [Bacteroidota bacterium]MDF2450502.1 cytidine deaminase [Bacteroidota bacterium]